MPLIGQTKPEKTPKFGEIKAGIVLVQALLGGTTKFYKTQVNPHQTALESAMTKVLAGARRPKALTKDEKEALRVESERHSRMDRAVGPTSRIDKGYGWMNN